MRIYLFLMAASLIPTVSSAQTRPLECGILGEEFAAVEDFSPYFTADDWADFRGSTISQVSEAEPMNIVTDSATCQGVHDAAVAQIVSVGDEMVDLSSYEFTVFRFGPYYAIVLVTIDSGPPGQIDTGYSPFLIFRMSDLEYLDSLAV